MPIVGLAQEIAGRKGSAEQTPSSSLTRTFQVFTDDPYITEDLIVAASGLPALGTAHPTYPYSEVVRINARQDPDGERLRWEVEIEYGTGRRGVPQTLTDQQADDPVDRRAIVKFRFEFIEYAAFVSLDDPPGSPFGKLVVNSAGDPFDPPLMMNEQIFVLTVTKNLATVDYPTMADYNDSVNSEEFLGFAKDEVWLTFEESQKKREGRQEFWPVTGVFKCRPKFSVPISVDGGIPSVIELGGWQAKVLDAGFRERLPLVGNNFYRPITDHGIQVSKPARLNGVGGKANPDDPPNFLDFKIKKRRDFNDLNWV